MALCRAAELRTLHARSHIGWMAARWRRGASHRRRAVAHPLHRRGRPPVELAVSRRCRTRVASVVDRDPTHRQHLDGRWRHRPDLDSCSDIDLGWTPATNLLPIRRLALDVGETATTTAVWVRFPEMTIEPSEQKIHAAPPTASGATRRAPVRGRDHGQRARPRHQVRRRGVAGRRLLVTHRRSRRFPSAHRQSGGTLRPASPTWRKAVWVDGTESFSRNIHAHDPAGLGPHRWVHDLAPHS